MIRILIIFSLLENNFSIIWFYIKQSLADPIVENLSVWLFKIYKQTFIQHLR